MMLWDVPSDVKRFFRPVARTVSKSIRRALPGMVLAFFLAPQRLGSAMKPARACRPHRRGPQPIGNPPAGLMRPTPTLEPPLNALQPGRKAPCLADTHRLSPTRFVADSQRYHIGQNDSCTLAASTPTQTIRGTRRPPRSARNQAQSTANRTPYRLKKSRTTCHSGSRLRLLCRPPISK